jgi:excisionase family DNA binding protein
VVAMAEQREPRAGDSLRPDDLISAADAASIAGRSVRTIRRAYRAGKLLAYRDGNGHGVRIRYGDLRQWLTAQTIAPSADRDDLAALMPRPAARSTVAKGNAEGGNEYLALLRAARRRRAVGRGSAGGTRVAGSSSSRQA